MAEIIAVDIDNSRSFVTGSFRVTGQQEKIPNVLKLHTWILAQKTGRVIFMTDFHSEGWWEFKENGGPYPRHSLVRAADDFESPRPMPALEALYLNSDPIVACPAHVRCQNEVGRPEFTDLELTKALGVSSISDSSDVVLRRRVIYAPKIYLDATRLRGDPDDRNVFSMLEQLPDNRRWKGAKLHFVISGVVTNICVMATAVGLRQLFPMSRITILRDCISPFVPKGFGDVDVSEAVERSLKSGYLCDFSESRTIIRD